MATAEVNQATIKRFYDAFNALDGDAMAACYSPSIHFSDPVFPDLNGEEAADMWRMLTGRAEDLKIDLAAHDADESTGTANWIAHYTFRTGRKVVNDIQATFAFDDAGLIADHHDSFDFWKWTRMVLGPIGIALGWSPIVQGKVRSEAAQGLEEFRAGRS